MNEIRYRVRRWLYGSPFDCSPRERAWLREYVKLSAEHPREVEDFTSPTGRTWRRIVPVEGIGDELAFRRYARRSGERVCLAGGYTRRGVVVDHSAACFACRAVA